MDLDADIDTNIENIVFLDKVMSVCNKQQFVTSNSLRLIS